MSSRSRSLAPLAAFLAALGCGPADPAGPDGGDADPDEGDGVVADDGGSDDGGSDDGGSDDGAAEDGLSDEGTGCDPFAVRVVSFAPGPGAGNGADRMPGVALGPPVGGGAASGGTDVVSLGIGGEIVLELGGAGVIDGPGADLIVFENPFLIGGDPERPHAEPGFVAVSVDGSTWVEFDCAYRRYPFDGCAGWHPVFAAPGNGIDPLDAATAGGDPFDLATLGIGAARYVRIRDLGLAAPTGTSAGFDLDAVAAVHACAGR